MSDVAKIIADLVAAGTPGELIGRVAAALASRPMEVVTVKDEAAERRREKDRERKRLRKSADADADNSAETAPPIRGIPAETPPRVSARVEDKTLFLEIEPQEETVSKKQQKEAPATPRSELLAVLDADHAGWVIDHRQRLRKPLTARAANQLAAKLGACPDPNAAADLMIEKGWQSIEVGWLDQQPRGSPGGGRVSKVEQTGQNLRNRIDELQRRRGEGGEGGGDVRSTQRLLAAERKTE